MTIEPPPEGGGRTLVKRYRKDLLADFEVVLETHEEVESKVVYWTPTEAETREIVEGSTYRVQRIVPGGEKKTYFLGFVILEGIPKR